MINNILKLIYQYIRLYAETFIYKPSRIRLEVCNLCQLDCAKCWMRKDEELIKSKNGGFGYLKFEDFKNFIDKNSFIKQIEIVNKGEIFLNPDLNKIIKYSYDKNVELTADGGVNLNYLTEETAEYLVKYNFQSIVVSIDGASQETYQIYRCKGSFEKVINNIKLINKYKEMYNSTFPKLVYKFIIFGHNEHEIEEAKKIADELNMEMEFVANTFTQYSPVKNKELVKTLTSSTTLNDCEENRFYQAFNKNWCSCSDLFRSPQINFNGDLLGCCVVYLENYGVNVFKTGLLKALRKPKVILAKAMLKDLSIKPVKGIPCSHCEFYKTLKKGKKNIKFALKHKY